MATEPKPCVEVDLDASSPVLCVSFSALVPRHQPFVNRTLGALPVKHVKVLDADATWFHTGARGFASTIDELAEGLRALIGESDAERVVTLGVASGSLPALVFTPLIGAQHCVVFSPVATIDPARREELDDRRWSLSLEAVAVHGGLDPRFADVAGALRSTTGMTFEVHVGGEDELGLRHADLLADVPGLDVIRHVEGGPAVAGELFDDGELDGVLARSLGIELPPAPEEPAAPPPFTDVDIVVLDPTGDADLDATRASIAEHAPSVRSVTYAQAQPGSFLASYHAVRDAIARGEAGAALILVAGAELTAGVLDELGAGLADGTAVCAPASHLRGEDRRTTPVPLGMAHLLHRPYTPMALMVDRAAYDRVGGFDADLGELALWDLCIRVSAESLPQGPRTTQAGVEVTRPLVSAGLPERYRDYLRANRDLPDEVVDQMAGDARREQQRAFQAIVERSVPTYAANVAELARLVEKARVSAIQSRKAARRSPNRIRDWRGVPPAQPEPGSLDASGDPPITLHAEHTGPQPWFTFPTIDYLRQLDFSDRRVFEYGSGSSTSFWSGLARDVVSVEHDRNWHEQIASLDLPNVDIILATGREYVEAIADRGIFDVIVVDGRLRYDSTLAALPHLSPDGLLILDNSERYPRITEMLRDQDLLQVDLVGPGPYNQVAWCTSLFFRRTFAIPARVPFQPQRAPGMRESFVEGDDRWEAVNRPQFAEGAERA
ncbi:class I SAM-dependent methyltransferase [Capillimicrobium parvum]|uniref:Uncharacterized protein n=1 Tax=Capillimicrobium parvum TaxID=2884022 RepID=A0A9E7C009_9ACTN|nr:class I SAM-dependent methyltransferase [Capillimicrobium parvum]UGS35129.1 hypothetical protein DSM104329_01514 [Capillimicrobium parvum]